MGNIKKATRYYLFRERVNISKRVNGFLYFLRKIPLLGKKISPDVYQSYKFKDVLFIIIAIATILFNLVMKAVYIGFCALIVWIFDLLINDNLGSMDFAGYTWAGLFLWLMVIIFLNVYNIWFSQVDPKALEFMDNFHLPKKFFIRSKLLIDGMSQGIYYIPLTLIIGLLLGAWPVIFVIPFLYISLSYLGHYLSRVFLSENKIPLMTQSFLIIIAGALIMIGGALLPIFTGTAWIETILFSAIPLIVAILLAIGCVYGILNFKREDHYLAVVLDRSTGISESAKSLQAATSDNVQKKIAMTSSSGKFINKKGNAYLNALLFDRYKKEFRKILRFRLIATAIVILGVLVINYFWDVLFSVEISDMLPLLNIVFIPMWISMFSVGRKMVQVVFINCDNAMLHYPFYRTKSVILSGFFDRLKRTLLYNSILAIAPLTIGLIIGFINNMDFSFMPMTGIIFISLLALFSFHDLFLYYILQPFADNMQVKSPLYVIINMASSMAIWFVIGGGGDLIELIFASETLFILILAGITVGYVGIGCLVLRKFAPKTFKAKG